MQRRTNRDHIPPNASSIELAQYKIGELVTPERMTMAMQWVQARQELGQRIMPIRNFIEGVQELPTTTRQAVGIFLARAILCPEGFERGDLHAPGVRLKSPAKITTAIRQAKQAGAVEIVMGAHTAQVRAVATASLLLTALNAPDDSWLAEQVRAVEPDYRPEQLWQRFDEAEARHYKAAIDLTPLPLP